MKIAFKLLWLLLLVALPAAILLTGWAQGLPVVQYGVSIYATMAIAFVIGVAITIYGAKHWLGEEFGEKQHKWLLERYAKDTGKTLFQSKFHAFQGAISAILLLSIGLPVCAALVVLVMVALLVIEGAIASYCNTSGRSATTPGRTRSDHP